MMHPDGQMIPAREIKYGDLLVLSAEERTMVTGVKRGLWDRIGFSTRDGAYQEHHPEEELEVVRGQERATSRFERKDVV